MHTFQSLNSRYESIEQDPKGEENYLCETQIKKNKNKNKKNSIGIWTCSEVASDCIVGLNKPLTMTSQTF